MAHSRPRTHLDATGSSAPEIAVKETAEPIAVRLTAPFGFVTEIDAVYFKPAGTVITNPLEIAALRERMAPIEDV